jgi:hypothetical protein
VEQDPGRVYGIATGRPCQPDELRLQLRHQSLDAGRFGTLVCKNRRAARSNQIAQLELGHACAVLAG